MKLTLKQDAFIVAYLETGNATESYRRAYNTAKMKYATIANNAYQLLKTPAISQRINECRELAINSANIDRAGVLKLITELATADASQLAQVHVRCCRHCWGNGFMRQWKNEAEFAFAVAEVTDQNAKAIHDWESMINVGAKIPKPEPLPLPTDIGGYGFDVFATPNPECPKCLGEGHVKTVLTDTRRLNGAAKRLFAGVKQTQNGIEIKTRDQDAMLAILAREYGIGKDAPPPATNVNIGIKTDSATVIATDPLEASRQYQQLIRGEL